MFIYIFILSIFIFLFLASRNKQSGQNAALFCVCVLILLAGLKYRVGSDALLYQDIYEQYPTLSQLNKNYVFSARWGALFVVWYSFCHTIFHDFIFYQFIHAIILLVAVYRLIRHYSETMMPAILMFSVVMYLFMTFDLYREGLAAALFMFGIPYLEKKNYIVYFALCFASFNIHTSSFLIFLVPLIDKVNLLKWNWRLFAVCFALAFILPSIIIPVVNMIPVDAVRALALKYLLKGIEVEGMTVTRAIFSIAMYYFAIHKNLRYVTGKNKLVLNLAFLSLLIETLQKAVPFIFRLNSYFSIFLIIALALTIERMVLASRQNMAKKYAMAFMIMLIYCGPKLLDYAYSEGTYNAYFPYVSIFDPHIISKREFHSATDYLYYDQ